MVGMYQSNSLQERLSDTKVSFTTMNSHTVLGSFVHISKARLRAVSLFKTVPTSRVSSHNWTSKLETKAWQDIETRHFSQEKHNLLKAYIFVCMKAAFGNFVGMRQTSRRSHPSIQMVDSAVILDSRHQQAEGRSHKQGCFLSLHALPAPTKHCVFFGTMHCSAERSQCCLICDCFTGCPCQVVKMHSDQKVWCRLK